MSGERGFDPREAGWVAITFWATVFGSLPLLAAGIWNGVFVSEQAAALGFVVLWVWLLGAALLPAAVGATLLYVLTRRSRTIAPLLVLALGVLVGEVLTVALVGFYAGPMALGAASGLMAAGAAMAVPLLLRRRRRDGAP